MGDEMCKFSPNIPTISITLPSSLQYVQFVLRRTYKYSTVLFSKRRERELDEKEQSCLSRSLRIQIILPDLDPII